MSFLDKVLSFSKTEAVEIKSLETVLKFKKITLQEAKDLDNFVKKNEKDEVKIVHYIGCFAIFDEEGPIFRKESTEAAKALTLEMVKELMDTFNNVNSFKKEELESKN